eukprot:CAMPEP_0119477652 /NCGR_PEP_ID=MMETSP1344-20130328/7729_1 /TAXON_ID=236787 /ORGANISM="Florenciella parvula, Strain CCMP2471" /LENGTH=78 /DNA_ID=CAMNT_0007511719 /DNA_START=304 /DNA_END=540 /DNA_ORIENTATION=-
MLPVFLQLRPPHLGGLTGRWLERSKVALLEVWRRSSLERGDVIVKALRSLARLVPGVLQRRHAGIELIQRLLDGIPQV